MNMKDSSKNRERRRYPRFLIDLPLEYQGMDDSCFRGGIVVNASETGFLIESVKDIPIGTELNITVLYLKGFEFANFKVTAKIVWKQPSLKDDWKGYQYGLEFIQILDDDRWRLSLLLNGQYHLEQILTTNEVRAVRKTEFQAK
jgi:hypothetical protein